MVQGTSFANESKVCAQNWEDKTARKAGYEAVQKRDQEKATQGSSKKTQSSGGNAWGSFKSRDNFTNMHLC